MTTPTPSPSPSPEPSARRSILLVDDDPRSLDYTRDMLDGIRPGAYQVSWASSYEKAREELLSGAYDLCLLDHGLGERTGVELLQEVGDRRGTTPVVMLTGYKDRDADMKAMSAGAADYLVKGEITPSLLERTVRYTIAQKRAEDQLREREESPGRSPPPGSWIRKK